MNQNDIEHMAQGFPPSHIGKDHEEVVTELANRMLSLQQKLDAVLAENVVSRKAVQTFCDVVGGNTHAICEQVGSDGVRAILAAMNATGNMPATDAILNAVREEGVEMVRRHPAISLCSLMHVCEEITAQLRAETDTTSSQYESLAGGK